MERDEETRFRITTWPGERLPHPPAPERVRYELVNDEVFVPDWEAGLQPPSPRYSEEIYLELAAIDLDDPAAIATFVADFGTLGISLFSDSLSGFYWLDYDESFQGDVLMPRIFKAYEAAGLSAVRGYETLIDFRWGATALRDLVAARRVVAEELDPLDHAWESPIWDRVPQDGTEELPWEPDGAFPILREGLVQGLKPCTPVLLDGDEPVFPELSLYQLCCLELFNHVVEEAPYRRCANETCGRLFVRQRGRSLHGQHRTRGVKYCSSECARQRAQRAYRLRKGEASWRMNQGRATD